MGGEEAGGDSLARAVAAISADGMGEPLDLQTIRGLAERGASGVMWQRGVAPPMAFRCPVCAGPVLPYSTLRFGEEYRCGKCGRGFDLVMVRRGLEGTEYQGRASTFETASSIWGGGGRAVAGGVRSPERATLEEIERDPDYRRRNHRRAQVAR